MKLSLRVTQYYDMSLFPAFTIAGRQSCNYHAININPSTTRRNVYDQKWNIYKDDDIIYFLLKILRLPFSSLWMSGSIKALKKKCERYELSFFSYFIRIWQFHANCTDLFLTIFTSPFEVIWSLPIARSRWISSDISRIFRHLLFPPSCSSFARQVQRQIYGFSWQ